MLSHIIGIAQIERFIVNINGGTVDWHVCHVTQTVQTRNLLKVFTSSHQVNSISEKSQLFFCNFTKMYYISAVRYVFIRE